MNSGEANLLRENRAPYGKRNQLIESLAPAFFESHGRVFLAPCFIGMDDRCGVFCAAALRGQSDHRGEFKIDLFFPFGGRRSRAVAGESAFVQTSFSFSTTSR